MNTYALRMEATKIFNRIIVLYDEAIADGKEYLKLDNDHNYMYLAVEKPYEENIMSLAHYGRQNGDAMCDHEMLLLYKNAWYYPMFYQNDYMHIVNESMYLSGETWKVNLSMQKGQRDFAQMWLNNIKQQYL